MMMSLVTLTLMSATYPVCSLINYLFMRALIFKPFTFCDEESFASLCANSLIVVVRNSQGNSTVDSVELSTIDYYVLQCSLLERQKDFLLPKVIAMPQLQFIVGQKISDFEFQGHPIKLVFIYVNMKYFLFFVNNMSKKEEAKNKSILGFRVWQQSSSRRDPK